MVAATLSASWVFTKTGYMNASFNLELFAISNCNILKRKILTLFITLGLEKNQSNGFRSSFN